jgi:hypothetical protein
VKKLADMTDEERLEKVKGLMAWLIDQARNGNPEAKLALSQIPGMMDKVRANRAAGITPDLRRPPVPKQ